MELKTLLSNLKKPLEYHWKIQSKPKEKNGKWIKGNCVAYIDSRDCQDILDMYCEEGWQSEFYEVKGKVFCRIGIKINGEWMYRSDSGALESNDNVEEETTSKGETSDAFKRACVQWGIGRFLYSIPPVWISNEEYEEYRYKITEFCNKGKKQITTEGNTKLKETIEKMKKSKTKEELKELYDIGKTLATDNTEKEWLNEVTQQCKSKFM